MIMEFLDVVNEKDEVIGRAAKKEVYDRKLMHRIVHVLIFNDKGEMALQLRSKNVSFCPLHWSTAVGGHVMSGESYEKAALREMEEEIGIETEIKFAYKDLYHDKRRLLKKILMTFRSLYNGQFKINTSDVELKFFSLEQIQDMIRNDEKIHPELLFLLERHFGIKHNPQ